MSAPCVRVDVTAARRGAREAIILKSRGWTLNPGDALAIADDLRSAAEFVRQLCPDRALLGAAREEEPF